MNSCGVIVHFVIDEIIISIFKWTCSRSRNNAGPGPELCGAYWLFSFHLAEHFHKHFLGLFRGNKLLIPVGSQRSQPSPYLFLKRVKWTLRFPAVSCFLWIHSSLGSGEVAAQTSAWANYPPQASAVSHSCSGLGGIVGLLAPVLFTHVPGEAPMVLFPLLCRLPAVFGQILLCVCVCVCVVRRQARQRCELWVILCR